MFSSQFHFLFTISLFSVVDLGEGPTPLPLPTPLLVWVKQKSQKEEKLAGQAKTKTGPLSSRSRSATAFYKDEERRYQSLGPFVTCSLFDFFSIAARTIATLPFIPGHECVGEVTAVIFAMGQA